MKSYDIDKILLNGALRDFVLGQGEYQAARPEEDAGRWRELKGYFNSSTTPATTKALIKQEIFSLSREKDIMSQRVALILSRSLNLGDIIEHLIYLLQKQEIDNLRPPLQNDVWVTIAHFESKELEEKLIRYIIKTKKIKVFLLTSQSPLDETVASADDLWRVGLLARFYEGSEPTIQNDIGRQLQNVIGVLKINSILREFRKLHPNSLLSQKLIGLL